MRQPKHVFFVFLDWTEDVRGNFNQCQTTVSASDEVTAVTN
jgi:hypothetical protein